jgi:hypothetical protein
VIRFDKDRTFIRPGSIFEGHLKSYATDNNFATRYISGSSGFEFFGILLDDVDVKKVFI